MTVRSSLAVLLVLQGSVLSGCTMATHRYSYVVPLTHPDPDLQVAAEACYLGCAREDPAGRRRFFSCIAACPGARVERGDVCEEHQLPAYGCHLWRVRAIEVDQEAVAGIAAASIRGLARVSAEAALSSTTSSEGSSSSSGGSSSSSNGSSRPSPGKHTPASPSRKEKTERILARPSKQ